eukprot:399642_1
MEKYIGMNKQNLNHAQLVTYNHLISMGFHHKQSITAAIEFGQDINASIQYILNHTSNEDEKTSEQNQMEDESDKCASVKQSRVIKIDHKLQIELFPDDTIADLKQKLEALIKIPPYKQCKSRLCEHQFRQIANRKDNTNAYDIFTQYDIWSLKYKIHFRLDFSIKPQYLQRYHPDESNCPQLQ